MGILIFAVLSFNLCFGFSANVNLSKNDRLILAAKKDGIIKVIENRKGQLKTTFESTASFGMSKGAKSVEGDYKTPVGIYFGTHFLTNDELPEDFYGPMAVVLNYPNPIDIMAKRTGSDIWIHGSNDVTRVGQKASTEGCIILENPDLLKLIKIIRLKQVPVIIADKATDIKVAISDAEPTTIEAQDGFIKYRVRSGLEKSKDIVYEVIK